MSVSALPAVRLLVCETLRELTTEMISGRVAVDLEAAVRAGVEVSESVNDALRPVRDPR